MIKALNDVLTTHPTGLFIGVVEFDHTKIVGVVDDPLGVDISALSLSYPLEYQTVHVDGGQVGFVFLPPTDGLPEQLHLSCDQVAIHSGKSHIGEHYLKTLKVLGTTEFPRVSRLGPPHASAK